MTLNHRVVGSIPTSPTNHILLIKLTKIFPYTEEISATFRALAHTGLHTRGLCAELNPQNTGLIAVLSPAKRNRFAELVGALSRRRVCTFVETGSIPSWSRNQSCANSLSGHVRSLVGLGTVMLPTSRRPVRQDCPVGSQYDPYIIHHSFLSNQPFSGPVGVLSTFPRLGRMDHANLRLLPALQRHTAAIIRFVSRHLKAFRGKYRSALPETGSIFAGDGLFRPSARGAGAVPTRVAAGPSAGSGRYRGEWRRSLQPHDVRRDKGQRDHHLDGPFAPSLPCSDCRRVFGISAEKFLQPETASGHCPQ